MHPFRFIWAEQSRPDEGQAEATKGIASKAPQTAARAIQVGYRR
jgi:hypothetical protein